ncbi:MAG TPA: hypothetical protein VIV40_13595 [Kofleriaceae bacterium]
MLDALVWIVLGATLIPAHRAARNASRAQLAALIAVEVIALMMCVLAAASERTWSAVAQEDGIVEWATFLAFMMAAGWLVVVVRRISPSWWFQGACLLLAAFCLVVAGEEISWGQRLFGFKPPDVFLERNFQQELNLHNVLMDERGLGFALESKHLVMAIVVGFCIAWPMLVRRKRFEVFAPLAPPFAFVPLGLAVFAAELTYKVELTGEGAELIAGLIFLASAIVAVRPRPLTVAVWLAAPVVVGILLSTVMTRVMFGSDEAGTRAAAAELALLQQDVVAGATDKLLDKTVHKRVYTSMRDGYLRLDGGAFLEGQTARHDRRGYFLDPWNNPYWVHYNKKTRSGAVYSFGPNRRRDVAIRDADSDPGDDVIVRFSIP